MVKEQLLHSHNVWVCVPAAVAQARCPSTLTPAVRRAAMEGAIDKEKAEKKKYSTLVLIWKVKSCCVHPKGEG